MRHTVWIESESIKIAKTYSPLYVPFADVLNAAGVFIILLVLYAGARCRCCTGTLLRITIWLLVWLDHEQGPSHISSSCAGDSMRLL